MLIARRRRRHVAQLPSLSSTETVADRGVRHGRVRATIGVEVGHDEGSGIRPYGRRDRRGKTPIAVTQENGQPSGILRIRHDEIEHAIAVHVGGAWTASGASPSGEGLRRLEGTVAVAQQDASRCRAVVCFVAARSRLPSASKSATVRELAPDADGRGAPGTCRRRCPAEPGRRRPGRACRRRRNRPAPARMAA